MFEVERIIAEAPKSDIERRPGHNHVPEREKNEANKNIFIKKTQLIASELREKEEDLRGLIDENKFKYDLPDKIMSYSATLAEKTVAPVCSAIDILVGLETIFGHLRNLKKHPENSLYGPMIRMEYDSLVKYFDLLAEDKDFEKKELSEEDGYLGADSASLRLDKPGYVAHCEERIERKKQYIRNNKNYEHSANLQTSH